MSHYPQHDLWSRKRTPYAVYCHRGHGLVYLTKEDYDSQMSATDDLWVCPICGHDASWDDDNYQECDS